MQGLIPEGVCYNRAKIEKKLVKMLLKKTFRPHCCIASHFNVARIDDKNASGRRLLSYTHFLRTHLLQN